MAVEGRLSPSGVWIADDFRSNLIIDRYDPVFADMRASKLKHLRSANSEDAVTWNVFRSLRQVAPEVWLPELWRHAFPGTSAPEPGRATVSLWKSVAPPLGLLAGGDEGESEIDVVIEAPTWVWFIEAKLGSDISTGTTTRSERDQVLRNIDVGTHYAGVRDFQFSLLILSEPRSRKGADRVDQYRTFDIVRSLLALHRPDGLPNLQHVGLLKWSKVAQVLSYAATNAPQADERIHAERAASWLRHKLPEADNLLPDSNHHG
ncbi:hypothetical protein HQN59_02775 [Schlegelella sp. ID0723]|uniref:PD-(D/E)XK nuclease superfamily protein n=2 Tax=Piscinibacter koreensis TaxID=2742824 RepID=A0A7Y6NK72_9BURK|nr:hypothetical protein [Schlegelella koreensis]